MYGITSRRAFRARNLCGFGLGWAVVCFSPSVVADDEPGPCPAAGVTVTGAFGPSWTGEIAAACSRLLELAERDPDAKVTLRQGPDDTVQVRVALSRGRTADRVAREAGELTSVLEALVTLPPVAPMLQPVSPPAAAPPPGVSASPTVTTPATPRRPAPRPPETAGASGSAVSFDVAAVAVGRAAGEEAQAGVGIVGSGNVDIQHGWLVGLRVRADVANFELDAGHLDSATFGGGLELGRRFVVVEAAQIDLGLGVDGLADVNVGSGGRSSRRGRVSDDVDGDVRPRVFTKLWAAGPGLSFCALLGFEVSPLGLAGRGDRPAFGGELGIGIGWMGL